MKSILGIGNALTDILAVLPDDDLLVKYHLPKGSMQHVDEATGDKIWQVLKRMGVQYVPGGSAANTIAGASIFGMKSGFIGKVGDDELGSLFKTGQENIGIKPMLLKGTASSGRAMVFVTAPNAERTFAVYLGAALELGPEDLKPHFFEGYDYFHIEGYLVQNQALVRKAVELAKQAGSIISIDMASYNVVESNKAFLHDIIEDYVDIVFANETEAKALTGKEPREALEEIASICKIAVVKLGPDGSMVKCNAEATAAANVATANDATANDVTTAEATAANVATANDVTANDAGFYKIEPYPANCIDATGAGDIYAAGFLYAHSLGMPVEVCGKVGSIISSKVVEVIGPKVDIPRWKAAKAEIRQLMGQESTDGAGISF